MRKQGVNQRRQQRLEEALASLEDLEALRDEVGEVVDNLHERFSGTQRYQSLSEIWGKLDAACDALGACQDIDFTAI